MPTGSTEQQVDALTHAVNEHVIPMDSPSDFAKNANHHIGVIADAMEAVAEVNQGVARTCQVGIHTADSQFAISSVIRNRSWHIELKPFVEG